MSINATVFGQFVLVLAIAMLFVGYYLGKRKTTAPIFTAFIGALSALIPPFTLVFIIVLALRKDVAASQ